MEEKTINKIKVTLAAVFSMGMLVACDVPQPEQFTVYEAAITQDSYENYEESSIPDYSGKPYVAVNNNVPYFSEEELTTDSYEFYSPLDSLGRCGVVHACVGQDIMPTEERGGIGSVKPTGWKNEKYDVVEGKYLYNRCHLIGYQLTGENANKGNLITGTRYLNIDGMLPFENMVADYVKETGNHVMYRVTPVFEGDNLLADGVWMEAKSVEDNGEGILFNVYCYNVQPGISINYADGSSCLEGEEIPAEIIDGVWIVETGSKYHKVNDCGRMNPENAKQLSEEDAKKKYEKCSKCW